MLNSSPINPIFEEVFRYFINKKYKFKFHIFIIYSIIFSLLHRDTYGSLETNYISYFSAFLLGILLSLLQKYGYFFESILIHFSLNLLRIGFLSSYSFLNFIVFTIVLFFIYKTIVGMKVNHENLSPT